MLRIVGAGLPRTATLSLKEALELLLGAPCYHMVSSAPHTALWDAACEGAPTEWDRIFDGYAAAVDWPASVFWRELSDAYPSAVVLLSVRESADEWLQSADRTVLNVARLHASSPEEARGVGMVSLLRRFTGRDDWDDVEALTSSYESHNASVRARVASGRLVEWRPTEGWPPICDALRLPVPDLPFPHLNRTEEWL